MSGRRNFRDADKSVMEKNLRFAKSDLEENLNQFFSGSKSKIRGNVAEASSAPPRDFKVVQPSPDKKYGRGYATASSSGYNRESQRDNKMNQPQSNTDSRKRGYDDNNYRSRSDKINNDRSRSGREVRDRSYNTDRPLKEDTRKIGRFDNKKYDAKSSDRFGVYERQNDSKHRSDVSYDSKKVDVRQYGHRSASPRSNDLIDSNNPRNSNDMFGKGNNYRYQGVNNDSATFGQNFKSNHNDNDESRNTGQFGNEYNGYEGQYDSNKVDAGLYVRRSPSPRSNDLIDSNNPRNSNDMFGKGNNYRYQGVNNDSATFGENYKSYYNDNDESNNTGQFGNEYNGYEVQYDSNKVNAGLYVRRSDLIGSFNNSYSQREIYSRNSEEMFEKSYNDCYDGNNYGSRNYSDSVDSNFNSRNTSAPEARDKNYHEFDGYEQEGDVRNTGRSQNDNASTKVDAKNYGGRSVNPHGSNDIFGSDHSNRRFESNFNNPSGLNYNPNSTDQLNNYDESKSIDCFARTTPFNNISSIQNNRTFGNNFDDPISNDDGYDNFKNKVWPQQNTQIDPVPVGKTLVGNNHSRKSYGSMNDSDSGSGSGQMAFSKETPSPNKEATKANKNKNNDFPSRAGKPAKRIRPHDRRYRDRRRANYILSTVGKIPEAQRSTEQNQLIQKAINQLNQLQTPQGTAIIKRQQSADAEPGIARSQKKSKVQEGVRYSDISRSSLLRAVVDNSHPRGNISFDNWSKVNAKLLVAYAGVIRDNPGTPARCTDAGWYQGRIKLMAFDDQRSIELFEKALTVIGEVWSGAKLCLVEQCVIPNRPRGRIKVPDIMASNQKAILELLEISNPSLDVKNWKVLRVSESRNTFVHVTLLITDESSDLIKAANNFIVCGFTKTLMWIYKPKQQAPRTLTAGVPFAATAPTAAPITATPAGVNLSAPSNNSDAEFMASMTWHENALLISDEDDAKNTVIGQSSGGTDKPAKCYSSTSGTSIRAPGGRTSYPEALDKSKQTL